MGGREYAQIAGADGMREAATVAEAGRVVERGLFALPSFAATGGPFQGHLGIIVGTPQNAAERAALAAVYTALMTCEAIECTGNATRVYVDGPFASNEAYCAVLAAALPNTEVHASEHPEGTAIGASLLAHVHGGSLPRVPMEAHVIRSDLLPVAAYARAWRERVHLSGGNGGARAR
jgi:sugar (pentulose or hexulose) kinase